jgi:hypothetical protein
VNWTLASRLGKPSIGGRFGSSTFTMFK